MNITRFSGPAPLSVAPAKPKSVSASQFNQDSPVYFGATVYLRQALIDGLKLLGNELSQRQRSVLESLKASERLQGDIEKKLEAKKQRAKELPGLIREKEAEISKRQKDKLGTGEQESDKKKYEMELETLKRTVIRRLEVDLRQQKERTSRRKERVRVLGELKDRAFELSKQEKGDVDRIESWMKEARARM